MKLQWRITYHAYHLQKWKMYIIYVRFYLILYIYNIKFNIT